jgi:hypothetical protein
MGGSVEGNGIGKTLASPDAWGIKIEDAGHEGAVGAALQGVYFEGNNGDADLLIDQDVYNAAHSVHGCSFVRYLAAQYVTSNIRFDRAVASARSVVHVSGCGFKALNTYTEDPARPYFTAPLGGIVDGGNMFGSDTAMDRTRLNAEPQRRFEGRVDSAGAAVRLPAGWSCTRNSTGVYTVTHNLGLATSKYAIHATAETANPYFVQRVVYSTNSFQVVTTNVSNVANDAGFAFTLTAF